MTTIRKTITITDAQDAWIKAQIDAGTYTNDSEAIRDLIRKAQTDADEIAAIRASLIEAEQGGFSNRTPEQIRAAVKQRRAGKQGDLAL